MSVSVRVLIKAAISLLACILVPATGVGAPCDELVSRLLLKHLKNPIENAERGPLGMAGLDKRDHHLESVCYSSNGPVSSVIMVVSLTCKTSDRALIKASVSEKITGTLQITGADCKVSNVNLGAAGEIGKVLLNVFNAQGKARDALQNALTNACN
jgi:hypothetical protein